MIRAALLPNSRTTLTSGFVSSPTSSKRASRAQIQTLRPPSMFLPFFKRPVQHLINIRMSSLSVKLSRVGDGMDFRRVERKVSYAAVNQVGNEYGLMLALGDEAGAFPRKVRRNLRRECNKIRSRCEYAR